MMLGALRDAHPTGPIELEVCDQSASGMATLAALGWKRNEGNADCVLQRALSIDGCASPPGLRLQLETEDGSKLDAEDRQPDDGSGLVLTRVSAESEGSNELCEEIMMMLMGWTKLGDDPRVSMYCADLAAGVAEDLEELEVYYLRKEGVGVGLVHLEPAMPGAPQQYLMNMVIGPEQRRQGLGSLALQAMARMSCDAGRSELATECTKPEAVAFFLKNSFAVARSFSQWQQPTTEPEPEAAEPAQQVKTAQEERLGKLDTSTNAKEKEVVDWTAADAAAGKAKVWFELEPLAQLEQMKGLND